MATAEPDYQDRPQAENPVLTKARGMDHYIGCKIIAAQPMDERSFLRDIKGYAGTDIDDQGTRAGYLVIYPDGYQSWSPKEVFDAAYRKITVDELDLAT